jgi:hypothetical protein
LNGLNQVVFSMAQIDPCSEIITRIVASGSASIAVPALSKLLGVKSTTLNARFRRQQIPLRTIGRTSYLPRDLALHLVELHRYALLGWPTLLAASKITDIKPATLKARCEKGQLEGYVDLTKRLRLNPDALGAPRATASPSVEESRSKRLGALARHPFSKPNGKCHGVAGGKETVRIGNAGDGADPPAPGHAAAEPVVPVRLELRPAPAPKIAIITAKDYGLSEAESRAQPASQRPQRFNAHRQPPPLLVYDPLNPISLSDCARGKTISYGEYVGTILGLIDDPYNPMIKVAFPEHPDAVMREVLLAVAKRKVQTAF